MTNTIEHKGVIQEINNAQILVRIIQTTACSSCSANNFCPASEKKEKEIEIPNIYSKAQFSKGEVVKVIGKSSLGFNAVLLAFVIPFILVIVALFVFMRLLDDELYSAIISLACLAPYYFVLWLCRNRLKKIFMFKIEPIK